MTNCPNQPLHPAADRPHRGRVRRKFSRLVHSGRLPPAVVGQLVRRMTTIEVIIRLAAIGLLSAYLVARHRRRVMGTPLSPEDPSVWTGHGIDTRTLRPRLESVRGDYCAARRTSPPFPATGKRRAWARQTISRLAYFRHRHDHDEREHQIA